MLFYWLKILFGKVDHGENPGKLYDIPKSSFRSLVHGLGSIKIYLISIFMVYEISGRQGVKFNMYIILKFKMAAIIRWKNAYISYLSVNNDW